MSDIVPDRENSENELPLEIGACDMDVYNPVSAENVPEPMDVLSAVTGKDKDENATNERVIDMAETEEDDSDDLFKPEGNIHLDIDCFSEFCRGPPDLQQRLSKPVFVRGLPWKILAIPRDTQRSAGGRSHRALGFFLQCNGDSETVAWNCIATASLKVVSQDSNIEDHSRRISHTFYPKENDWGYSQFLTCDHLANPDNGYIKNDMIRLVVHVAADAPHGVQWDSKKHAGYIGLKNQGATCYMNSILQTLFFTNKLRKAVYEMPTIHDEADNNVALAMQRVFYDLQHSDRPVGTKKLTKSFGWDSLETFMQHDVQELCRVLLDNLESKMKGSVVEDTIPNLFRGKTKSFIKCTDVDFESSREEAFYDIQLNVKGKNDILESFREYVEVERLDGENKYDAGELGMQPAEKGVKFLTFPPVLHLQLMRFQYDPNIDSNVKINDRFEFPDRLNLNEFVESGGCGDDYTYCLHAVLVHSGDFHGGHYVVFINTNLTGPGGKNKSRWCKFDDDVVSRATARDAINANFGGEDNETLGRTYTNAYMLVYVRQNVISDALCPIADSEIPGHLRSRFESERTEEIRKKKEKMEAHLYTEIMLLSEDRMMRHHGFDLIDVRVVEDELPKERIEKGMTVAQLYDFVSQKMARSNGSLASGDSDTMMANSSNLRIWKFDENTYKDDNCPTPTLARIRPTNVLSLAKDGKDKTLESVLENDRNLLFIEGPDDALPPFDEQCDMMMFMKYYTAANNELTVVGHIMMGYRDSLSTYTEQCCRLANLPLDTPLRFYEEVSPDRIRCVDDQDMQLCSESLLLEVNDGGILIFENAVETNEKNNAKLYLEAIYNKIDVEIVMNTDNFLAGGAEAEQNIMGTIGLNWNCDDVAKFIGENIKYDHEMILLWKMSPFNERPAQYLNNDHFKTLRVRDLLGLVGPHTHDPRRGKRYRLFYTKMPIKVVEMDKRRQMKVQLMDEKMNIQEITIFPEKNGTVSNILAEARREFRLSPNGTGKLRLVYVGQSVHSMRVYQCFAESTTVMEICQKAMTPAMYMVRVEEVPADQVAVLANEYLLPVAHFDKDPARMFGVPFYLKVYHDEPLTSVRDRIQQQLDVSDKEIEKYRFALVISNRIVRYLDMESNGRVNLAELGHAHVATLASSPFLGIDHMNKSRGSRSAHATEKPIIIHN